MTRRDWWLGVLVVVVALLVHAGLPRYEWRTSAENVVVAIRIDRWTGAAELGSFLDSSNNPRRRWAPMPESSEADEASETISEEPFILRRPPGTSEPTSTARP